MLKVRSTVLKVTLLGYPCFAVCMGQGPASRGERLHCLAEPRKADALLWGDVPGHVCGWAGAGCCPARPQAVPPKSGAAALGSLYSQGSTSLPLPPTLCGQSPPGAQEHFAPRVAPTLLSLSS